jgi:hypothetical protein
MARLEGIFTTSADAGKRLPATTIRGITPAYQCRGGTIGVDEWDVDRWIRLL